MDCAHTGGLVRHLLVHCLLCIDQAQLFEAINTPFASTSLVELSCFWRLWFKAQLGPQAEWAKLNIDIDMHPEHANFHVAAGLFVLCHCSVVHGNQVKPCCCVLVNVRMSHTADALKGFDCVRMC